VFDCHEVPIACGTKFRSKEKVVMENRGQEHVKKLIFLN
jgi:hypothetical protein